MPGLTTRLRTLVDRVRSIDPHAVDAFLALAFTAAAFWTLVSRAPGGDGQDISLWLSFGGGTPDRDDLYRGDDFLGVALVLLQTLPMAARRVSPLWALTISATAIALHAAIGYEGVPAGTSAPLIIVYSAASLSHARRAVLGALITLSAIGVYFTTNRGDPGLIAGLSTSTTYIASWGLGIYARSRRQYTNLLEERAALLEQGREAREREAVADERARIARELHDMVGHALNLVVIQAGGAQRVFETKPGTARDALTSIESIARQALEDMERMLGILREAEGDDGLSPQPSLRRIDRLAARVSEAGLPVDVTVEGTPADLPSSVDLSAYRIVQEALTNALKHAGAAHARVVVRHGPDCLELEITDDGRGVSGGRSSEDGGGRGLIGMRERVGLFGGELSVGPRPEGGFRVHARLPLGSPPG